MSLERACELQSVACVELALLLWSSRGLVGEPDVAELDGAGVVCRRLGWAGETMVGLGVEQLEDALAGGHGGLQDVVLLAEVLMGRKKRCAYWMKATRTPMVTMLPKKLQCATSPWGGVR